jgi:hypothetical protein
MYGKYISSVEAAMIRLIRFELAGRKKESEHLLMAAAYLF